MEVKEKEELLNTSNANTIEKDEEVKNAETFTIINDNENTNHSDVLKIFGILTLIFVLLLSITFFTFTLINTQNEKIIKGVYIINVDVSNLTKEEAKLKVTNYINSSLPEEIKLKHNDFEVSLSTSQLSIYFNIDEAVDIAYQIGKTGNIFERGTGADEKTDPAGEISPFRYLCQWNPKSCNLPDKTGRLRVGTSGRGGKRIRTACIRQHRIADPL